MKIDAKKQQEIIDALNIIREFVEHLQPQKSCHSCANFINGGCHLASGATPPAHVIKSGCPSWEIFTTPPF